MLSWARYKIDIQDGSMYFGMMRIPKHKSPESLLVVNLFIIFSSNNNQIRFVTNNYPSIDDQESELKENP
jgi:hypothetical protein